jgi:hypothetical protein
MIKIEIDDIINDLKKEFQANKFSGSFQPSKKNDVNKI